MQTCSRLQQCQALPKLACPRVFSKVLDPFSQAEGPDGMVVAVKALSLRRMTDWKQLELFEREAKTLKSLDHPGIPKYIDYLSEDTEKDRGFFLVQASSAYLHKAWPTRACIC